MIDQLRPLAIFAKTVHHGSFREAAKALKLSPSVVSHHISQLEERLGVALLYRTTRKLTLTLDGARLFEAASRMLEAVEDELHEVSRLASSPVGELRVSLPAVLAQSQIADALTAFKVAYPDIVLSLDFTDERKNFVEHDLDVAIRMVRAAKKAPTRRILFSVARNLVVAPDVVEDADDLTHPQELIDRPWLLLRPVHEGGITLFDANMTPVTIKPRASMSSNDVRALHTLVGLGGGIAALPEFLVRHDIESGAMRYLLPDWQLPPVIVHAEWPLNAPRRGLIRLFVDHVSASLAAATTSGAATV